LYGVVAGAVCPAAGLNGFLVLQCCCCLPPARAGTRSSRRSRAGPGPGLHLAFIFASCVPVYTVFLAPEILHFTLVLCAYFLWLYKEVAEVTPGRSGFLGGFLRSRASDVSAAILLGAATYSKPTHALLIAPIVLWSWWRRRWAAGLVAGAACVLVAGGLFGMTALNTGEFNYQGGDRKAFYATFPFDGSAPDAWNARGVEMTRTIPTPRTSSSTSGTGSR